MYSLGQQEEINYSGYIDPADYPGGIYFNPEYTTQSSPGTIFDLLAAGKTAEAVALVKSTREPLYGSVITLPQRTFPEGGWAALTPTEISRAAALNQNVALFVDYLGGSDAAALALADMTLEEIYAEADIAFGTTGGAAETGFNLVESDYPQPGDATTGAQTPVTPFTEFPVSYTTEPTTPTGKGGMALGLAALAYFLLAR